MRVLRGPSEKHVSLSDKQRQESHCGHSSHNYYRWQSKHARTLCILSSMPKPSHAFFTVFTHHQTFLHHGTLTIIACPNSPIIYCSQCKLFLSCAMERLHALEMMGYQPLGITFPWCAGCFRVLLIGPLEPCSLCISKHAQTLSCILGRSQCKLFHVLWRGSWWGLITMGYHIVKPRYHIAPILRILFFAYISDDFKQRKKNLSKKKNCRKFFSKKQFSTKFLFNKKNF